MAKELKKSASISTESVEHCLNVLVDRGLLLKHKEKYAVYVGRSPCILLRELQDKLELYLLNAEKSDDRFIVYDMKVPLKKGVRRKKFIDRYFEESFKSEKLVPLEEENKELADFLNEFIKNKTLEIRWFKERDPEKIVAIPEVLVGLKSMKKGLIIRRYGEGHRRVSHEHKEEMKELKKQVLRENKEELEELQKQGLVKELYTHGDALVYQVSELGKYVFDQLYSCEWH
jgi:hypothetical protein